MNSDDEMNEAQSGSSSVDSEEILEEHEVCNQKAIVTGYIPQEFPRSSLIGDYNPDILLPDQFQDDNDYQDDLGEQIDILNHNQLNANPQLNQIQ